MFILPIPFFVSSRSVREPKSIIKDGEKYTTLWWARKLNLSKQVAFCRLRTSNLVEKVKFDDNEIIKFVPKEKSVEEILKELR